MLNHKTIQIFKLFLVTTSLFAIIGCGSSTKTKSNNFDIGNTTYHTPDDVEVTNAKLDGVDAKILSSGEDKALAGFVQLVKSEKISKSSNRLEKAQVTQKSVGEAFALLNANYSIRNMSLLSKQSFHTPYDFTIAHYQLVTYQSTKSVDLAKHVVSVIGGDSSAQLPYSDSDVQKATVFRFILLYGEYENSSFYISVVVPENQYNEYQTVASNITTGAKMTPRGQRLETSHQSFTGASGSGKADFVFVIDNSGSMSNNQNALAQAAYDFTHEMSNSGLHSRSVLITTDDYATNHDISQHNRRGAYQLLNQYGVIENNNELLTQAIVAGTGGSSRETGIWNAEQALQSRSHGDTIDGAITKLGIPKDTKTVLSVIIISDEDSQYTRRSNGVEFNVLDNLFVDRAIRVYSIIEPSSGYSYSGTFDPNNDTQYDDLATATGGMFASIENTHPVTGDLDFSSIMKQIAQDAGGAASSFTLPSPAVNITTVKVNGTAINQDATNGWTYLQSSNSIVFHGTSLPNSGESIEVSYKYYQ